MASSLMSWLGSTVAAALPAGDFNSHTGVSEVDTALEANAATDRIVKRTVQVPDQPGRVAFVLEDVLSKQECERLIEVSERVGYRAALVSVSTTKQVMDKDYRDSDRCMVDSPVCAEEIFRRIRPFMPEEFHDKRIAGVNERLRFLRYRRGNKFAPHYDGRFSRMTPDGRFTGEESFFTIMLYLSDVAEGGSTRFLSRLDSQYNVDVVPKPGMVLIFEHPIYHQGTEVASGEKYCIRSDIMYKPK
eukprot:m.60190 g.60190  ORF g.60190 m.60190 type:complete len:245 (+) comp13643_c0_seq1:217-951(+)